MPHFAIVKYEITSVVGVSANTPPENRSSKIRMKGITVIAAVVFLAMHEIRSEVMSAEKVMRKKAIVMST